MKITQPTLLINEHIARRNISRMSDKANSSNVTLRPHFKTHQSEQVGAWFRDYGVTQITVSSVQMAQQFAAAGWQDITIAFPVNWLQIDALNALAAQITLGLIVESPETVVFLRDNLRAPVDIWIDVDTGYKRTGVAWDDNFSLTTLGLAIQPVHHLRLRGVLTHAGHSYALRDADAIRDLWHETAQRMTHAHDYLASHGFGGLQISVGDTPTCSVMPEFTGVDEVRPGNFVYYDLSQAQIGSCTYEDIAVAVACPVVAKQAERNQIVIYGGAVHLSQDRLPADGAMLFGLATRLKANGTWTAPLPNTYVVSLSQEHGIIHTDDATFNQIQVGDVLAILPVHSCLSADLLRPGQQIVAQADEPQRL